MNFSGVSLHSPEMGVCQPKVYGDIQNHIKSHQLSASSSQAFEHRGQKNILEGHDGPLMENRVKILSSTFPGVFLIYKKLFKKSRNHWKIWFEFFGSHYLLKAVFWYLLVMNFCVSLYR